MTEPISCRIRWRGQTTGPFPLATILRRLDDNELGLWHEIEYGDTWMTLEQFLARPENEQRFTPGTEPSQPRIVGPRPPDDPEATPPARDSSESAAYPAPPVKPFPAAPQARPKRLMVFVAAGFFLGFVGAHNFYAGYRGTAVTQVLLTGVLYSLGFGLIATWIWALIELLVVHSDRRGLLMV